MKKPNVILKAAALTSSLLLTSALVLYRGGAVNWFVQPAAPAHVAVARSGAPLPLRREHADTPEVAASDSAGRRPASVQGMGRPSHAASTGAASRSGGTEDTAQGLRTGQLQNDPTFMTSSKSMVPLVAVPRSGATPEAHADSSGGAKPVARDRVFMGSSKSLAPLIEPAAVAQPDTSRRDTSTPSKHVP
ncbi:MAG: hypothetical protein JST22_20955 [Bacteroidetes bacterium]|nr:hypothetical protein [Bacteroidota bacterium]